MSPKKKMVQTNILQLLFLAKFTFATITTSISASSMASFNPRFDFSGVDLVLYRGSYSIYADGSIVSTNVAADARVDTVFGNWKNACPLKGQVGYETRSVRCKYPGIGIMYVFPFALLINLGDFSKYLRANELVQALVAIHFHKTFQPPFPHQKPEQPSSHLSPESMKSTMV